MTFDTELSVSRLGKCKKTMEQLIRPLGHPYTRLVPQRYHRPSGLDKAWFNIEHAWHHPCQYIYHTEDVAASISPSALCELRTSDGETIILLVEIDEFPTLAEAILLFGKMSSTGNRVQRFITLYKVYECLEPRPEINFSAVRHGLSHAGSVLSRPKTVAALNHLFGGANIDLSIPRHLRIFYMQFVDLLIEVDKKLFTSLQPLVHRLRRLPSRYHALSDWQVGGRIEGYKD
ncbi:MAG: hypothetical protein JWQ21_4009 [Herminiimonas sp.]|nr:hypothetical protein [Herminiimonas sp.]